MIDRSLLEGYGARDGMAVVAFTDGRELQLLPEWRNDLVKRIQSVRLLDQGQVIAQVVSGGFRCHRPTRIGLLLCFCHRFGTGCVSPLSNG